jgi:hypothetical protein
MTRVEDTVLDLVERARSVESVVGLVTRACQRRLTTASRLAAAMEARKKMRCRRVVSDILEDVRDGVASALERAWGHAVEQRHGLPQGERNRRDAIAGGVRYRDIGYRELAMIVELDGRAAHPDDERHRDMRRDNAVAEDWRPDVALRLG